MPMPIAGQAMLSGQRTLTTHMNTDHIIEDEILEESRRCFKITNTRTGIEFPRQPDGSNQNWPVLYKHAVKNPREFYCEYDDGVATSEDEESRLTQDGQVKLTEAELLERSIPQLRDLCKNMEISVPARAGKTDLIVLIRKATKSL